MPGGFSAVAEDDETNNTDAYGNTHGDGDDVASRVFTSFGVGAAPIVTAV